MLTFFIILAIFLYVSGAILCLRTITEVAAEDTHFSPIGKFILSIILIVFHPLIPWVGLVAAITRPKQPKFSDQLEELKSDTENNVRKIAIILEKQAEHANSSRNRS